MLANIRKPLLIFSNFLLIFSNVLTIINSSLSENFIVSRTTLAEREVNIKMTTEFSFGVGPSQHPCFAAKFSFGVGPSQHPCFAVLGDEQLESLQRNKNAKNRDSSTAFDANKLRKFYEERKIVEFSKLLEVCIKTFT